MLSAVESVLPELSPFWPDLREDEAFLVRAAEFGSKKITQLTRRKPLIIRRRRLDMPGDTQIRIHSILSIFLRQFRPAKRLNENSKGFCSALWDRISR